jgi:hypothetical protein
MGLKKKRYATFFFLALTIVAIGLVIYFSRSYKNQVFQFLNNAHLIPTKEAFTELYFVIYPTLRPSEVVVGKKIDFSFVIHNVEGKDVTYPYKVYFKSSTRKTYLIDSGNIFLKNGGKIEKNESYTTTKRSLVGNMVVYLENLNRYIYFSVPNKNLILDSTLTTASSTKTISTTTNQ